MTVLGFRPDRAGSISKIETEFATPDLQKSCAGLSQIIGDLCFPAEHAGMDVDGPESASRG